jgi:hypothetical protein
MIYLTFSAGLVISLHYCGGDLASLKLFAKATCCCDDESTGKNVDCCKDEVKTIKISDDQNIQKEIALDFDTTFDVCFLHSSSFFNFNSTRFYSKKTNTQRLPRPPERASLIPPYKLNHSFLFYS